VIKAEGYLDGVMVMGGRVYSLAYVHELSGPEKKVCICVGHVNFGMKGKLNIDLKRFKKNSQKIYKSKRLFFPAGRDEGLPLRGYLAPF